MRFAHYRPVYRFNSQPPEGGWLFAICALPACLPFQLTAARRRLDAYDIVKGALESVSTHSRPKAAGTAPIYDQVRKVVSTHSRPKAAGRV